MASRDGNYVKIGLAMNPLFLLSLTLRAGTARKRKGLGKDETVHFGLQLVSQTIKSKDKP